MCRLKVQIDKEALKEKPKKGHAIKISDRIPEFTWNVSIEELADYVGNKGHTFLPAKIDGIRDAEHFVCQKIFALDFDKKITVEEFFQRARKFEIEPVFVYETLSSTQKQCKFRAVFVNDITINDRTTAEMMIKLLRELFPESDKACTDVSRMFFGGKNLIYLNSENRIDIWSLSIAVQAYIKFKDKVNYARKIQSVASKLGILLNKNVLSIHRRVTNEIEDFERNTNIKIMVNFSESSFFYVIEKFYGHSTCMRASSTKKKNLIEGFEENMLIERCRLCQDFFTSDLSHDEKFLIATNLLQIKNGENIFFKAPIENIERWKTAWDYIRRYEYKAQHCKNICPYYEMCQARTMIDKVMNKMQQIKTFEYGELCDSVGLLDQYLYKAVIAKDYRTHLIKAQTAIGKTKTYCDIVATMPHKTFMIVVPTNELKKEVAERLEARGVETYVTPSIKSLAEHIGLDDLSEEIEELYNKGYGLIVKGKIRECIENQKLSAWQEEQLNQYLSMKEHLDGSKCVVTTHALFLGLEESLLSQYEIIVDEDILMTTFKNTASITFRDLEIVLEDGKINGQISQRILQFQNWKDKQAGRCEKITLDPETIKNICDQNLNIGGSLVDFIQADSYHVDLQEEKIDYFCARKIPGVKMTIVSATLVPELYRRYCMGRSIEECEVPIAKYTGKLKQYIAHSLSRNNMKQIGYSNLIDGINKVTEDPNMVHITFKAFSEGKRYYYGNTEGLNIYAGKDIAVVGTPHNIPFIYKLIGAYLGFNANDILCRRFVEQNGYRFKFMTYEDADMRMLQFYFIESVLEQTVGRARLLRHPCTVYLFSNYPLHQAEIIQEDYLKLEVAEE